MAEMRPITTEGQERGACAAHRHQASSGSAPGELDRKVETQACQPTWTLTENIRRRYAAQGKTPARGLSQPARQPHGPARALHRQPVRHPRHQRHLWHRSAGEQRLRAPARRRHQSTCSITCRSGTRVEFVSQPVRDHGQSRMAVAIWKCTSRCRAPRKSSTPPPPVPLPMTPATTRFIAHARQRFQRGQAGAGTAYRASRPASIQKRNGRQ